MKQLKTLIDVFLRKYFTDYNPVSGFWSEAIYSWWEQLFWNTVMGMLFGLFYGLILTAVLGVAIWILSHFMTIPFISDQVIQWIDLLQTRKRFDF